ncbi:MAG: prepilin-type N-terminal cleavage/methylation domain-containing protein [Cyanomargarita calcarea GSE-NOS-MK-12-04C]|jgi:type IV pilus assembly protein PilA|uniref:Prepilin-type N-terminal cleavage/methylation domain-containing protein n=1 Tax=Cyanomargarita calcarea GSE-NOS-MK-12-04C TaxID=2839659 RepID=A0A951QN19_9CYAN|nr:prepilin-type N-terminal cleavage/methylation domain-containing protein [Cyanomargarita calcarea GSE-NOS-MK-12-04C]
MLKPELQVKFLHNLNRKKKGNEGFTLIELLVVVIIIGVLAAIALPSLLSQVSKARQSEGKQNMGAVNRAQQAYYLENANTFTSSMSDLAIGIKSETENYAYSIRGTDLPKFAVNQAASRAAKIKSYAGIAYSVTQLVNGVTEGLTQAILCEAKDPNPGTLAANTAETITDGDATGNCTVKIGGVAFKQIK